MPRVFISHAEEDSALAKRFAGALERLGYETWYFERDAIPGCSYLAQIATVIADRPALLLLISSASLASHEVSTELRTAHRSQCHFMPVLVDVNQSEMHDRQPEWSTILGLAASIRLDSSDFDTIVARIILGLKALGVLPSTRKAEQTNEHQEARGIDANHVRKMWASDAHQIDIRDLDEVVFRNRVIDDFLNKHNRTFLSASKGLGKTLLLTYKRRLLQDAYRDERTTRESASVFFVPEGKPYLDFMGDLGGLSSDHKQLLATLPNTKKCWSFALRLSATSFSPYTMGPEDAGDVSRFPPRMQNWLHGHRIEPTLVFKELMSHTVRDINQLLDRTETFLEQKYRAIHHGIFFFVDKADQAIRDLPRDAWIHVQAGLIEASWDAMNANSHIKIFASIRQEAFANYESDIKTNLFGATATISYSRAELRALLDQLTRCYERHNSFKDFIHIGSVRNPKSLQVEDAFQYLERHSLSRPRDLVIIADELSRHQDDLGEPTFRRIVDDTSSRIIAANVFDENRVFLDSLRERSERLRFLSLIPKNIFAAKVGRSPPVGQLTRLLVEGDDILNAPVALESTFVAKKNKRNGKPKNRRMMQMEGSKSMMYMKSSKTMMPGGKKVMGSGKTKSC